MLQAFSLSGTTIQYHLEHVLRRTNLPSLPATVSTTLADCFSQIGCHPMRLRSQTSSKSLRILIVLILHLAILYSLMLSSSNRSNRLNPSPVSNRLDKYQPMSLVFIKLPVVKIQQPEKDNSTNNKQKNNSQLSKQSQLKKNPPEAISAQSTDASNTLADPAIANVPVENSPNAPVNRNLNSITKSLERDLRFEQQKIEAAKPPNQIAREYWQKQNYPYKDKWEELAHKIEKAGKPRGLQMETFKAADGTQITKIGNSCFKTPDPGRTYLHQAEARPVICPR